MNRRLLLGYGLRCTDVNEDKDVAGRYIETFEKCSILFKFKDGENFNHRNTWSILRIKI
jgi:hypothetical protein